MFQNIGSAAPAAPTVLVKDTTTQTFVKDVIEESKRQPVLVDFWAPWCGPCKQLTPILEKVVKAAKGKVKLVKMDIDKHPPIPRPAWASSRSRRCIAFVNGQPVDGFLGALPESQVTAFIERLTKDTHRRRGEGPAEGGGCRAGRGRSGRRRRALCAAAGAGRRPTSTRWPGWRAATSRPARSSRPRQTLAMVPEAKRNDAAVAAARAALELAEQAKIARADRRAGTEGRGQSARPSGALRSCRRAQRQGQAAGGASTTCSKSSGATANGTTTARASSWCSSSRPGARPTRRPWQGAGACRRSCSREADALASFLASC